MTATVLCAPLTPPAEITTALPGTVVTAADLAAAGRAIEAQPEGVLVVLAPSLEFDDVLAFLEAQIALRPWLDVVVMRERVELADVRRAVRAGARDVLEASDVTGLADTCALLADRAARRVVPTIVAPERTSRGKVITVFSAKGGAGKTTVATNLAATLNDRGAARVCLVDLDLEFGDVAITLRLDPRKTRADMLTWDEFTPDAVPSLLTAAGPRFDCLLAPLGPGQGEKLPPALTGRLLEHLAENYDYVVVDTPAGFTEHVLAALDASDRLVLITAPELPSLKNLRLTLDMLDLLGYSKDIRSLVVNRADVKAGLTPADLEDVTMTPLTAHIPSSPDVPASINRGVPLAVDQPEHPLSRALRRLVAERLDTDRVVRGKHRAPLFARLMRRKAAA
ncbi:MAG TPA: AAA family ATPase [Jatrophihabitantaceae bacterium]|nr:AAA family ATPase [Jatrophihabitantaceae bacterium]